MLVVVAAMIDDANNVLPDGSQLVTQPAEVCSDGCDARKVIIKTFPQLLLGVRSSIRKNTNHPRLCWCELWHSFLPKPLRTSGAET